jgi:hypothetical protein
VSPPQPPALALPRLSQALIGAELSLPAPAPAVLVPPEPASRHPAELLPHVASQRLPSAVAPTAAGPRCSAGAGESAVPLGDFEAAPQVSRLLCLLSSPTADEHNKHYPPRPGRSRASGRPVCGWDRRQFWFWRRRRRHLCGTSGLLRLAVQRQLHRRPRLHRRGLEVRDACGEQRGWRQAVRCSPPRRAGSQGW